MTKREMLLPWAADDDADATLGRLMRAGRNDGPPAESLRAAPRAVAALLATSVTGTPSAAAGSMGGGAAALGAKTSLSAALLAKWFAAGALAGGTVVVAANVPRFVRPPPPEARADVTAKPPLGPPDRPSAPARGIVTEPRVEATMPSTTFRTRADSDVAREVAILDRARAALAAGSPARALEVLDTSRQLPARALVPEATILRVRALLALGDIVRAREVTDLFASRAPDSPQLGVLHGLLEAHGAAPPLSDAGGVIRTPGSKL
jgi:hypothetical protein